MTRAMVITGLLLMGFVQPGTAQKALSGHLEMELLLFPEVGAIEGQKDLFPSIAAEVHWARESADRSHRLVATVYGRADGIHQERSHLDVRELYWQGRHGRWELAVGARQVFWGVAESNHVVDVLNQADVLDDPAMETKLGQPMAQLTRLLDGGTADLYVLPYFRTREFPSGRGRFQPPIPLDAGNVRYESPLEEWRPGVALRLARALSRLDFALSHYWGYDPEPEMVGTHTEATPIMYHDIVHRTGLELLLTGDATLYKLEAAYQQADRSRHALVVGVEHTVGDVMRSGRDLILLLEYTYDSYGAEVFTGLDDDIFAALRLSWNDVAGTELTVGAFKDRRRSSMIGFARTSRRFAAAWRAKVEARVFNSISPEEFLYAFRKDTHVRITVSRYF